MTPEPASTFDCPSCGQNLSAPPDLYGSAIKCPTCENSLMVPTPKNSVGPPPAAAPTPSDHPKLWNPETAALLSFLFCPLLGPLIHHLNWQALGRSKEAGKSLTWIWIFGILIVLWQLAVVLAPGAVAAWPIYIIVFAIWYGKLARKQTRFLQQDLGGCYAKRSLLPPTLLAIVGTVALILVANVFTPKLAVAKFAGNDSPEIEVRGERLSRAQNATEKIILKTLKSPSTARFSGFKVVESNGDYFLTLITVDSQNGFGAMIRGHFITVFKMEGDQFRYDPLSAVEEVPFPEVLDNPNMDLETTIIVQKRQIKWPGFEKEISEPNPQPLGNHTAAVNGTSNPASAPATETRPDGGPSDYWVHGAAGTLNSDLGQSPFKRGEILKSLGGPGLPANTLIYPIQVDGFPLPMLMSKDSFGSWQFSIDDEPKLFKAREPESQEQRRKREAEKLVQEENAKKGREQADAYLKAREEEGRQNRERMEAAKAKAIAGLPDSKSGASPTTPTPPEKAATSDGEVQAKLTNAKSELAALETRMSNERKRYSDSLAVLNRLTANKTKPVQEGTQAHRQALEASGVIQEVESKAPAMKAEKARLEETIKRLEGSSN